MDGRWGSGQSSGGVTVLGMEQVQRFGTPERAMLALMMEAARTGPQALLDHRLWAKGDPLESAVFFTQGGRETGTPIPTTPWSPLQDQIQQLNLAKDLFEQQQHSTPLINLQDHHKVEERGHPHTDQGRMGSARVRGGESGHASIFPRSEQCQTHREQSAPGGQNSKKDPQCQYKTK